MCWFRQFRVLSFGLLLAGFAAVAFPAGAAGAAGGTRARLLLPVETVRPGETFLAGIELTHAGGWHTYWRHGGDSGKPTSIEWKLPDGVTSGAIRWPLPERHLDDDFVTYVYQGTTVLLVPLTIEASATAGPREVSADVKWLECQSQCIPGRATVRAGFTVGTLPGPSPEATLIASSAARLPEKAPAGDVSASWEGAPKAEERTLVIRFRNAATPGSTQDFFPDGSDRWEVGTATEPLPTSSGRLGLRKKVRKLEGEWPTRLTGLWVEGVEGQRPTRGWEVDVPIGEPEAGGSSAPVPPSPGNRSAGGPAPPSSASPTEVTGVPILSFGRALLLAVLGGLVLNVMPCVLPVIALKILGFVRQGGSRPAEVAKLGVVYGLGVWFSFLVLAGAVILVKRAAGAASWGMQFGNPVFLVAMTTLVTLVALSLFGIFEINVTGRALDAAGELTTKEGSAGAFFNGMLAVALATPCTAPFLAPALGYAFAAPPIRIIVIFSAVALGLALPYLILSFQPALLRYLPKPGAWMERFKIAMGFPMLATALWLYTLAARHFGEAGPLWLGLFLVGVSLAAWVWGEFVQRGRRNQRLAMVVAMVVAGTSYALALEQELRWRSPAPQGSSASPGRQHPDGIDWGVWSTEAVTAARGQGRPVFVDFTADWCLTCQLNERSSIEIAEVRAKLVSINAVALKGDHTLLPPAITAELQRFRRAGVPLVLVYPKDPAREPTVLPEVLTPSIVLAALDDAAR